MPSSTGLLLKHSDELRADDLAFLLRISCAGQFIQEAIHCVHIDQVGVHLMAEHLHHLFWLALAQQPVVDVDTGELFCRWRESKGQPLREESTPPERASRTFRSPTCCRISSTWSAMKFSIFQSGLGAAHTEHEIGEGLLAFLLIAGPGLITLCGRPEGRGHRGCRSPWRRRSQHRPPPGWGRRLG